MLSIFVLAIVFGCYYLSVLLQWKLSTRYHSIQKFIWNSISWVVRDTRIPHSEAHCFIHAQVSIFAKSLTESRLTGRSGQSDWMRYLATDIRANKLRRLNLGKSELCPSSSNVFAQTLLRFQLRVSNAKIVNAWEFPGTNSWGLNVNWKVEDELQFQFLNDSEKLVVIPHGKEFLRLINKKCILKM